MQPPQVIESPPVGAMTSKAPSPPVRWREQGHGAVAILWAGRDWFPGGPYNRSGRGSIPRRSTFAQDSRYLTLSQ